MATFEQIEQSLSHQMRLWERSTKRQQIPRSALFGLQIGLSVSIIMTIFGRLVFHLTDLQLIIIILSLILFCVSTMVIYLQVKRLSIRLLSQQFDQTFDLQEQTSTALELLSNTIQADPTIKNHQVHHAYQVSQSININQRIHPLPNRSDWIRTLILGVVLIALLLILPAHKASQEATNLQNEPETAIIQGVQEDIQEIVREIALDPVLQDETRQALMEELSAIVDTLNHESISVDEALALIDEAQTQLQNQASTIRAELDEQNQALEQALETLQNEDASFNTLEEALQNLAEQIEQAEEQSISAEQIAQAAEQLSEQAPELAEQLQQIAEQIAQDPQSAQETIEQALDELQQLQQEQMQQEQEADNLESLAEQLQQEATEPEHQDGESEQSEGLQSTDDTGGEEPQEGESGDTPSEEGAQEGQEGEQSSEQSPEGEDSAEEPSSDSGDTDQEQGENNSSSNQEGESNTQQSASSDPAQQDDLTTQEGEAIMRQDTISVPQRILDESESEIRLETDETTSQYGDFVDNPTGTITVPYNEVFNTYHNSATSALDQSYIPIGLRDVVRDYFTAITPTDNR